MDGIVLALTDLMLDSGLVVVYYPCTEKVMSEQVASWSWA